MGNESDSEPMLEFDRKQSKLVSGIGTSNTATGRVERVCGVVHMSRMGLQLDFPATFDIFYFCP